LGIEIFDYEILPMLTDFVTFFCYQSCSEKENVLKYDLRNHKLIIRLSVAYRLVSKERLERILNKKEDEGFKHELLDVIR